MLEHRYARLAGDALDQPLAAARHNDVHVVLHGDQFTDRGPVGGFDHLDRAFRQSGLAQTLVDAGADRLVGMDRLGTAAQNGGIAGLQAQPGGVRRDVGARFVDDADDTERHAHAPHLDAGRAVVQAGDFADRIGQRGDLAQSFGHGCDALRCQRQPIHHRSLESLGARSLDILPVRIQQASDVALDGLRHGEQCVVFCPGVGLRHLARGGPRGASDRMHVGLNVHDS